MLTNICLIAAFAAGTTAAAAAACPGLPKDVSDYSSTFVQPSPPLVVPEFATHFVQHKWFIQKCVSCNPNPSVAAQIPLTRPSDKSTNHITTGYIRNTPSKKLVTVDQTTEQGVSTSVFDFSNTTAQGLVDNTLTSIVNGDFAKPDVWRGYVNPIFPLFTDSFLVDSKAVFNGLVSRPLQTGKVASVSALKLIL